jgi:16S rRNA processing protein RimM
LKASSHTVAALPGEPVESLEDPVVVGRIVRVVGLRGELKVLLESDDPERLQTSESVVIRRNGDCRRLAMKRCQAVGGGVRLSLGGIETPESAAQLVGGEIIAESADRPAIAAGNYYADDIVGCEASADDGTPLGKVREVLEQGHHDIWVVEGKFGEILVPAVKQYILAVDLEAHRITVRRVDGLWDEE